MLAAPAAAQRRASYLRREGDRAACLTCATGPLSAIGGIVEIKAYLVKSKSTRSLNTLELDTVAFACLIA
jgi:hypothetical protein